VKGRGAAEILSAVQLVLLRHGVGYRLERTGIFQYYIRRDASHPVQSEPTPLALAEPEPGRVGAAVGPRRIYPR
jgi:hypothetical protein